MPNCTKCGSPISTTSRFCSKCGSGIASGIQVRPTQSAAPQRFQSVAPLACKYHPHVPAAGSCVDCHNGFCQECEVPITRHGSVCLDCGAQFAMKKLRQAHIAAGIGCAIGLFMSFAAISERQWLMALWPPIVYTYFLPAIFFGWHYGGKIWTRLAKFADHFDGFAGLMAGLLLLSIRLTFAIYAGVFGGGIIQYLRYRKLVEQHRALMVPSQAAAASV